MTKTPETPTAPQRPDDATGPAAVDQQRQLMVENIADLVVRQHRRRQQVADQEAGGDEPTGEEPDVNRAARPPPGQPIGAQVTTPASPHRKAPFHRPAGCEQLVDSRFQRPEREEPTR